MLPDQKVGSITLKHWVTKDPPGLLETARNELHVWYSHAHGKSLPLSGELLAARVERQLVMVLGDQYRKP